ncbi:hypothetical protein HC928_16180, partial [bacterium]|nr:hypothetical protein [bacterium]
MMLVLGFAASATSPVAAVAQTNDCLAIDFEGFNAGTVITSQIAGVTISAVGGSNDAMIFDSANPTGGDPDLGSPHEDFGGPGEGAGGKAGNPGENSLSLGNILIISEDGDSGDPDDNGGGGQLIFEYDDPTDIAGVEILDVDRIEVAGEIRVYDANDVLLNTANITALGDNAYQIVPVNQTGVSKLIVDLPGSGAVAGISCTPPPPRYNLGNFIWNDLNQNGIQDAGEPGIAGVQLDLYVAGENFLVNEATTDANGFYNFPDLVDGNYEVEIVGGIPAGFVPTSPNVGNNDAVDSDFIAGTFIAGTAPGTIAGADNLTVDGGFFLPPQVMETCPADTFLVKFEAQGGNLVPEGDDEGVTVSVTGTDGAGEPTSAEFTSIMYINLVIIKGGNGPIEYKNVAFDPSVQGGSFDNSGLLNNGGNTPAISNVQFCLGDPPPLAGLGNFVWEDLNENGLQDAGEPGVPGVVVTLFDGSGNPVLDDSNVPLSDTTDANGFYEFTGLQPGTYNVLFNNLPSRYVFTAQNAGDETLDSDVDPDSAFSDTVTLAAGEVNNTLDAGIVLTPVGLRIIKYNDANQNGDDDEVSPNTTTGSTLAGWQFFVYDAQGNYVTDGTTSVVTPGSGDLGVRVDFNGLQRNTTYTICEVPQAGWVNSDPGANSVADPEGQGRPCKTVSTSGLGTFTSIFFGNYQELGSITIRKNVDDDAFADMMFDFEGELGEFSLSENGAAFVASDLPADTYTITEVVPANWDLVSIDCGPNNNTATVDGLNIVLEPGENVDCTFNNVYIPPTFTLRMIKYNDLDGDGTNNEVNTAVGSGLSGNALIGWEFVVYDSQGNEVGRNTTSVENAGANGDLGIRAGFPGLISGETYTICETQQPGWVNTQPGTIDPTYGQPCETVTLTSSTTTTRYFGNQQETGSITIEKVVVYNADIDTDSGQDFGFFSAELGNFSLDDPASDDGDGVTNTVTFSDLTAGSYTISEGPDGNWTQTVECVGDSGVTYLSPDTGATIDLDGGENVTCTFTNTRNTVDLTYDEGSRGRHKRPRSPLGVHPGEPLQPRPCASGGS